MRKLALLVLAALAATAVIQAPPATATATIHLDVDYVLSVPIADCDVSVASGANGLDVLDAAVTSGCIDSYATEDFGFGLYVTCINDICETPAETFNAVNWTVVVDGRVSEFGVSDLAFPADGSTLQFSFGPWAIFAPCFVSDVC